MRQRTAVVAIGERRQQRLDKGLKADWQRKRRREVRVDDAV